MVKMENKNRPNTWKMFDDSNVEQAKKNGWTVVGEKPKAIKSTKTKKGDK